MRKKFLAVLVLIGVVVGAGMVACEDFRGATRLDDYGMEAADALQVANVECDFALIIVGETIQCHAYNTHGAEMIKAGQSVVLWSTDLPSVGIVDLDGFLTGQSSGTVIVTAQGEGQTTATDTVTIQ